MRSEKCSVCRVPIDGYELGIFSTTYVAPKKGRQRRQAMLEKYATAPVSAPPHSQAVAGVFMPEPVPQLPRAKPAPKPKPIPRNQRRPALNTRSGGGYSNSKSPLCVYYENGNCINGSACTFAHGLRDLR